MNDQQRIYLGIQHIVDVRSVKAMDYVSRDEIAIGLLKDAETRLLIEDSLGLQHSNDELLEKAGNYVDWLNADITGSDARSDVWNHGYYSRIRRESENPVTGKVRETYWLMPSALQEQHDTKEILKQPALSSTEKAALVLCRVGQGIFRLQLLEEWQRCPLTGCDDLALLRASHVKPWRASDNRERMDPANGILLAPNVDAAFDQGLITFDHSGRIVISNRLSEHNRVSLGIRADSTIELNLARQLYMAYHRDHVFQMPNEADRDCSA